MRRTKLDKKIDSEFAIFQMNHDILEILGKVRKKFPETKEFMDKELEKVLKDFDRHIGLHETGKIGKWMKLEFDDI